MKLRHWVLGLSVIILHGLIPIEDIDVFFEDDKNCILVENQQCGCPCPNGRVIKGKTEIPSKLKVQYPSLIDNSSEISLVNFHPFDNITENYNWVINSTFKIKGEIIGIDSISCGKLQKTEINPILRVEKWTTSSYIPTFMGFNTVAYIIYFSALSIYICLIVILLSGL